MKWSSSIGVSGSNAFQCAWNCVRFGFMWGIQRIRNTQRTIVNIFFFRCDTLDNEQQLNKCITVAWATASQFETGECTYFSFESFVCDNTRVEWVSVVFFLSSSLLLLLLLWRFKINSEFSFDSHHRVVRLVEMLYYIKLLQINRSHWIGMMETVYGCHPTEYTKWE